MSVLKAPPKQPRNATLQIRVDEELKLKLDRYAEFLNSTAAYVVSEALKLVFNKDGEFKEWLESQAASSKKSAESEASLTSETASETAKELSVPLVCPPKAKATDCFDDDVSVECNFVRA